MVPVLTQGSPVLSHDRAERESNVEPADGFCIHDFCRVAERDGVEQPLH